MGVISQAAKALYDAAVAKIAGVETGADVTANHLGTGGSTACAGNDSRLSDSRTPTAHATTHKSGGTDAIKLNELAAPTAAVAFNSQKATAMADPTVLSQEGATAHFVDSTSLVASFMLFQLFGNGKDGALSSASGTTTLTQDTDYSSITLTGTAILECGAFRLRCSGNTDIRGMPAGTIRRARASGNAGAAGGAGGAAVADTNVDAQTLPLTGIPSIIGGAGGTAAGTQAGAGALRPFSSGGTGGSGGAGGAGSGGAGGAARAATAVTRSGSSFFDGPMFNPSQAGVSSTTGAAFTFNGGAPGGSGSGGGGDGTAGGGGGSSGLGGCGLWFATRTIQCGGAAAGVISSLVGNGGAGGTPAAGNRGGGSGAGGAGGGWAHVTVGQLLDAGAANAVAADGGTGGNGGNGTGTGVGGNGGAGGAGGRVCVVNLAAGTSITAQGTGGAAGGAASGTAGGTGGAGETTRVSL